MKRTIFVCATILFALMLTAGAFVSSTEGTAAAKASAPQKDVPVKIADKSGRTLKVESLPRETQAQVERARQAARSLLEPGSGGPNEKIKVTVSCSHPPLKCTLTVEF